MVWRQRWERFPKASVNRANQVLQLIHSDLVGPMPVQFIGQLRYFVVFTNDYTRKSWVYFMSAKGQTFQIFQTIKSKVEKETRTHIKCLRTDKGGEFLSHEFIRFLAQNGINHQLTMAQIPQQNGVAERRNRTIIERACSIATASNYPGYLWPKVVNTANHLVNLSLTNANSGILPDQVYYGNSPKANHLRIFGSLCFLHIPKELRSKLDSKIKPCFFIGYDEQSKAYRIFDPTTKKIHISRDIVFDEQKIGYQHCKTNSLELDQSFFFPEEEISPSTAQSTPLSLPFSRVK
jgi:hypothetical protein